MGEIDDFEKRINHEYSIERIKNIFNERGKAEREIFICMAALLDGSSSHQLPKHLLDKGWTLSEIEEWIARLRQRCDDIFGIIEMVIEDWKEDGKK